MWHPVVPIGGTVGGAIGWTEGGVMPQTVGGHIGGRSIELEHSGTIWPLTHRQAHPACASTDPAAHSSTIKQK
jgi:hypothetical protein